MGDADAAETEHHQANGDVAKDRNFDEELHLPGDAGSLLRFERAGDEALLHEALHLLNDAHRKFPLALDFGKLGIGDHAGLERGCKQIRGYDGVLHGLIDANTADGRHDVSRVAVEEKSRLVPQRTKIGFDGEKFELVPIGQ